MPRRVGEKSRPPDCISLEFHRDHAHNVEHVVRWAVVALLTVVSALGLANVFGQQRTTETAVGRGASLEVAAPTALRGGLFFEGRFSVVGERGLRAPTLFLESGWFESITLNTVQPEPVETSSENGGVAFTYDKLPPGRELTVYLQFQVNPATVGRRSQGVELRDGDRVLTRVDRSITIYP